MRLWIFGSLMLALAAGLGPAVADTPVGAEATTGTNIFSTPAEGSVPTFTSERGNPGAKIRQALLGNTRDGIPDFKQIQMLPTLTVQQRGQLRELNKGNKVKVQQLVEQLKKLKEQRDTAGGAVTADMRAQFEQLRSELQALRKQSWEQSKSCLTDAQIRDIQAMKRGELQPSTFHGSDDGNQMMNGQ
jgi:hypothetical protein